jgi:galactokinase
MNDPSIVDVLERRFGSGPAPVVARAPGRVNLIGEHTDYNGGLVLPFSITRITQVALRPRTDGVIRVYAARLDESCRLERPFSGLRPSGHWMDYLKGLLAAIDQLTPLNKGFDGIITGDVPLGAGLSSSAALEVALAAGLSRLYRLPLEDLDLVKLCQRVENDFVGTHCGIMDPYASYFGARGAAILLDTSRLTHRTVPLDLPDTDLLVVDSRVERSLAASGYNARREECEQALRLAQDALPGRHPCSLSDLTIEDLPQLFSTLPAVLAARTRHVITENARVREAVAALEDGDAAHLGELLDASHDSLRDDFAVSTPELDFLVDWGRAHGAIGARLVGGGFGGVTLHLVRQSETAAYREGIDAAYRARFDRRPQLIEVAPGPGAKVLNADGPTS